MHTTIEFKQVVKLNEVYPDTTIKQLLVLMYLVRADKATVSDIVRDTKITQSVVSRIVQVLYKLELVGFEVDPLDGRKRYVKATQYSMQFIDLS